MEWVDGVILVLPPQKNSITIWCLLWTDETIDSSNGNSPACNEP